jgi:hypothetical protein
MKRAKTEERRTYAEIKSFTERICKRVTLVFPFLVEPELMIGGLSSEDFEGEYTYNGIRGGIIKLKSEIAYQTDSITFRDKYLHELGHHIMCTECKYDILEKCLDINMYVGESIVDEVLHPLLLNLCEDIQCPERL